MNHLKSTIIAIAMLAITEPWRAGFNLVITSPSSALLSISGDLNHRFISKMACESFISDIDLNGQTMNFSFDGQDYKAEIVDYELFCYQSLDGEET